MRNVPIIKYSHKLEEKKIKLNFKKRGGEEKGTGMHVHAGCFHGIFPHHSGLFILFSNERRLLDSSTSPLPLSVSTPHVYNPKPDLIHPMVKPFKL